MAAVTRSRQSIALATRVRSCLRRPTHPCSLCASLVCAPSESHRHVRPPQVGATWHQVPAARRAPSHRARRMMVIRMTLLTTERLFWQYGDRTAKPESAFRGRFLIAKACRFSVARGPVLVRVRACRLLASLLPHRVLLSQLHHATVARRATRAHVDRAGVFFFERQASRCH